MPKQGDVRRSKLYYLRQRSGKSARISEKNTFTKKDTNLSENKKTDDTPSDKKAIDKSDTSNSANEKIVKKASVNAESSKSEGEK